MRILKYVFLFVSIYTTSINSQSKSGIVIYKQRLNVKEIYDTDSIKNESLKDNINTFNEILKRNSGRFQYKLIFNNSESYYKREKVIEERKNEFALLLTGGNDEYYQNFLTNKIFKKLNAYGEDFIISSNWLGGWKLINEMKKIKGFTCFKATRVENIKNNESVFKKKIIAWYAPSLPFNFGPKGNGGLPGLILELNEGKLQYYVSYININPKDKIEISKPSVGKIVTQKEFDDINTKMTKKWYKYKS